MGGASRKHPVAKGGPGATYIEEKGRTSVHASGADLQDGDLATGLRPAAQGPPARGRGDPEVVPSPTPRQPTLLRGYKHPVLGTVVLWKTPTCRE